MARRPRLSAAELERTLAGRGYSVPMNRRRFLHAGAGAGAGSMLGLPPLLTGCLGDGGGTPAGPARTEARTLFFNFAHEDFADTTHHLVLGGQRHALTRTRDRPAVLVEARRTNAFLRSVPDAQLTHHLEAVETPTGAVQLAYVLSQADTGAGTWSMSGMYLVIPPAALRQAHAMVAAGPRPLMLSAKRRRYGHGVAQSAQDLVDEHALLDTSDHAATLVGLHPELLSTEPVSAAYLQVQHIAPSPFTATLGQDIAALGAAQPQATPGQPNDAGWATLVAMTDDNGQPMRATLGENAGLVFYNPEWSIRVAKGAAHAMADGLRSSKNDLQLGADVTAGFDPATGTRPPSYRGTIWQRRDGIANLDVSGSTQRAGAGSLRYTVTDDTPMNGLRISATAAQVGSGDTAVNLVLENWYLRWLGVFVEFYDASEPPQVIPLAQLPASLAAAGLANSTDTALYLGVVTPEFVLYGIPLQSSRLNVPFDFPAQASSAKILASGLGYGAHTHQATEPLGIALTTIFNLIVPTLLLGLGLSESVDALVKTVAIPVVNLAATEFIAFMADESQGTPNFANMLAIFWRSLVRWMSSGGALKFLATLIPRLAAFIGEAATAAAITNALPLIGAILQAIGALGTLAEITETSCEALLSPWTYQTSLVLTHDLSLTLRPDPEDNATPQGADRCQVSAMFDSGGTPRVLEMALQERQSQLTLRFPGVPKGGKVSIDASFVQSPTDPSQPHKVLGKASTGLVANQADQLADVLITNMRASIGPATRYQHQQKTALRPDGSGRQVHAWDATLPPPSAKQSDMPCAGPGDLCRLFDITVRQGTALGAGYVGYAWQGFSTGVFDCGSGGQSDSGQLANLNTDTGNGGVRAQAGYAALPCGLAQPRLAYSLLAHGSANFYLDPAQRLVRQVLLDPPAFADPRTQRAFGAFNLDSTALLLHPTGRLISIHQDSHKMETLRPSAAALSDADALAQGLAQLHAGQGTRPGLLTAPAAAAVSADGVVLVLEAGNGADALPRIQALDIGANAVQYFGRQPVPYFLQLGAGHAATRTYLDMAVEASGFIYVLSYDGSGAGALYWLDIYRADQAGTAPICSTPNVNAGALCVDFWRNVYTLNYEVLASASGQAEPSVSLWTPGP